MERADLKILGSSDPLTTESQVAKYLGLQEPAIAQSYWNGSIFRLLLQV
jgi:hypothetical protein